MDHDLEVVFEGAEGVVFVVEEEEEEVSEEALIMIFVVAEEGEDEAVVVGEEEGVVLMEYMVCLQIRGEDLIKVVLMLVAIMGIIEEGLIMVALMMDTLMVEGGEEVEGAGEEEGEAEVEEVVLTDLRRPPVIFRLQQQEFTSTICLTNSLSKSFLPSLPRQGEIHS